MNYQMLALILALTVVSWAQIANQNAPSTPQQSTVPADKAKCPCCDKMAADSTKDAHACCAHHDMNGKDGKEMASGKDAMSCCSGKDAKSCMRTGKDKAAASCCKDGCSKDSCGKDKTAAACCGGSCGKDSKKGCCSDKKSDKTAKDCCPEEVHS
jgi:hypothetical protein